MVESQVGGSDLQSRVDTNLLVTINIIDTGNAPHSDVSFNPWYEKQFAIIDDCGHWRVWDMQGRKYNRPNEIAHGFVVQPEGKSNIKMTQIVDGWAKILWATDTNALIACTRKSLSSWNLKSGNVRRVSRELDLEKNTNWILDVRRSSSSRNHILVLTSSQIFCLEVEAAKDYAGRGHAPTLKVVLSWRHSRDHEDTSLTIECFESGNGTYWFRSFFGIMANRYPY
jgi:RNA polymerase I-specific transcription initiation factor RRN6